MLATSQALRLKLQENTHYFRKQLSNLGFNIIPSDHPIIPVMLGDATLAKTMADDLLHHGIYVIGFSYPVVPLGAARIRVQISAAHEKQHLDKALKAFVHVGQKLGVIV